MKSAAKQRSAELLADFENQMGQQYSFDQDEVWAQAKKIADAEIAKAQKTVFDFQATKVLEDTVLKPEESRVEVFTFPTPKETRTFDVEAALNYAPVAGPPAFLQRIEAESSKGSQDPVFQPTLIVKKTINVPVK